MAPSVRFRGQPFEDDKTTGAFLAEALADPGIESLTIVVAWARFGGLRRLEPEITAFRERGGSLRIVLGIDEGGATVPGLRVSIRLADEPFVFHDRTARTFHPKVYLAEGPEKAILLVGSSNLTAGGLFSNYEASLEAEFELPAEDEAEALAGVRAYVATLLADEQLCLPLGEDLIERLAADPRYAISRSEKRRSRPRGEDLPGGLEDGEADQRGQAGTDGEDFFGASRHDKAGAPGLSGEARAELDRFEASHQQAEVEEAAPMDDPTPSLVDQWTKRLPATDAQHPPSAGSNPVGNLRLTKAGNPIDWRTWFRRNLFGNADWNPSHDSKNNPIETANVEFLVTIAGESRGVVVLQVDHAPHRESGQHNHATVLHWGPLMQVLRATNYTGHTVALQRMSDGSYRLDISP